MDFVVLCQRINERVLYDVLKVFHILNIIHLPIKIVIKLGIIFELCKNGFSIIIDLMFRESNNTVKC